MANPSRVGRRRVLRRGGLLLAGTALPLGWLLAAPAHGASPGEPSGQTQTVTLTDTVEAWYAAAPVDICTTPLGCPPPAASTSPYPADTLHVGLAAGQETARTYVVPDLAQLPFDATPTAGTMTLPVAQGTTDGTVSPQTAAIKACLATSPPSAGAQGSTAAPPAVDCSTSAEAVYDAAKAVVTVDLQPFLEKWHAGSPADGIALVPKTASAQPSDAWHVTFNGRNRAATPHISSTVTVVLSNDASLDGALPPVAVVTPAAPAPPMPAPAAAAPAAAPPVVAPAAPQAPAVQAQPVAFTRPFQYPLAFLFPLVLLVGAVFLARLFTRDATPRRLGV